MSVFKELKKSFVKHKWASLLLEVVIIVVVLYGFSLYQNRGTLAADGAKAPDFTLQSVDGKTVQLSELKGKKVLVYFFAPWCSICHLSGENLNDLRQARTDEELEILVVGLSWDHAEEVQQFADELELTMPILIGNEKQMQDYQIKGFPTYFVIDEEGNVTHRSVGYSTELGMRLRT
jgi:peroxiredoxin